MQNSNIFYVEEYKVLGEAISKLLGAKPGILECTRFPDGERYLRICSSVRNEDVIVVGGTINDSVTLDIFDLCCGLVAEGCRSLKIVIPFFGYSTMERAVKRGEVVTAKTRSRLFSAVPIAPFGNQVILLDLHTEGIPFYFEGTVKTQHLYAKNLVMTAARALGGSDFTLGSVDAGRAKWVESLANDLQVQAGFVYKRRGADGQVAVSGVNIPINTGHVIIYDDMIRSGNSILQAAEAYKAAGAKRISLITTHGVFTPGSIARLKQGGLISAIVSTDSHPMALAIKDPILQVVSTAKLFADYLSGVPLAEY
jgi:ribose-phosphate pyrophosphokinase